MDMNDKGHASQVYDAAQPDREKVWRGRFYLVLSFCAILVAVLVSTVLTARGAVVASKNACTSLIEQVQERAEVAGQHVASLERELFDLHEAKEDCHEELDAAYGAMARVLDSLASGPGGSNLLGQYRFEVESDLQMCWRSLARYEDENEHEDPCQAELNECMWYLQDSVPINKCLDVVDSMSDALDECLEKGTPCAVTP